MNQEILELIDKHLAKNVGDVLKKRLEEADFNTAELKKVKEHLNEKLDKISKLNSELSVLQELKQNYEDLENQRRKFEGEKMKYEVEKLKYQLSSEKEKSEFAKNIGLGLVRNLEYRNSMFYNESIGDHNTPQGWVGSRIITKNFTEEKSTE